MCSYLGVKVSKSEFIKLKELEKQLRGLMPVTRIHKGFDYKDWPIVKPVSGDERSLDVVIARWGFLPDMVHNQAAIQAFQENIYSINAQSENLFKSEGGKKSMWAEAARKKRCLVLSSGFVEYRHIYLPHKKTGKLRTTATTFPYWVTVPGKEYFYMAGISHHWYDQSSEFEKETFAVTTTAANSLMQQIHNTKMRMPTLLTEDLAYRWLFEDLTDGQIQEIAAFQYPADEMQAWTISRDFLTLKDPIIPFHYPELDEHPIAA